LLVKLLPKKAEFDPIISCPGVKEGLNNVNLACLTPTFPLQAWIYVFRGKEYRGDMLRCVK
jgi:hypothetical protein